MAIPNNQLPDAIVDALRRGGVIEVVKLLRNAKGIGLKEVRDFIDAQRRAIKTGETPADPANSLPPPVADALQRGNKIAAIRLLRKHTGLGLKDAKDAVDTAHQPAAKRASALSPGEVPQSNGDLWWILALVLAGIAGYYLLGGPG